MPAVKTPLFIFREIGRVSQILEILIKYEFGGFLDSIRIWEHTNIQKRVLHHNPGQFTHLTSAERLRLALSELGPTFIKLGQMLSTRPDILSSEIIGELEKLQDQVSFLPPDAIKDVIESELGKPLNEVFVSFEDQPIAAASIAQVHRAILNGEPVALKIQRPNIKQVIEIDLEIMKALASLTEKYISGAYLFNPVGLVNEFAADIAKELDFRQEVNNLEHFTSNFGKYPWIKIPRVFDTLCTEKIITMEYIDGVNITDTSRLRKEGYDLEQIAAHGVDISLKSVLEYGFFHADPHAGNMFILPGNVIGLVDFGMMGTFSARTRYRLIALFTFIMSRDEKRLTRILGELMGVEESFDPDEFEEGVAKVLQEHFLSTKKYDLGSLLVNLIKLARSKKIPFPEYLMWLTKTVMAIESISNKLGVDINLLEAAKPYAEELLKNRATYLSEMRNSYFWRDNSMELIEDLPYDLKNILHRLNTGKTQLEIRPVGMDDGKRLAISITNRMVLAFLVGTLFIASSVLVLAKLPPLLGNVPVLGAIGLIVALILGVSLGVAILNEGNNRHK